MHSHRGKKTFDVCATDAPKQQDALAHTYEGGLNYQCNCNFSLTFTRTKGNLFAEFYEQQNRIKIIDDLGNRVLFVFLHRMMIAFTIFILFSLTQNESFKT